MDNLIIFFVLFVTTILPWLVPLAILIGVPVITIKQFRRRETTRGRILTVVSGVVGLPVCLFALWVIHISFWSCVMKAHNKSKTTVEAVEQEAEGDAVTRAP